MKKACILSLILYFAVAILADNYKILQLNTSYVRIGDRNCKKGDIFSDESVIFWEQQKQAFKAQNLNTKEIKLFAEPDFRVKGIKTIKEYYVKTNRLSARGGNSFSDFLDEMSDTIYLSDSLIIEAPVRMDSINYFYVVYNNHQKRLQHRDHDLIIEKGVFDDVSKNEDVKFNLLYHTPDEDFLMKDSLTIIFIPWE